MVRKVSGLALLMVLWFTPFDLSGSEASLQIATPSCIWHYNSCTVEVYEGGGEWLLEIDCEDGTGGVWSGQGNWNGRCPGS